MWRFWLMLLAWLAAFAVIAAVWVYRLWFLAFPVNAAAIMLATSFSHRLILGTWLDYRPAFRFLLDREFRERITRPGAPV